MKLKTLLIALALLGCYAPTFAQTIFPTGTTTAPVIVPKKNSVSFSTDPLAIGACYFYSTFSWTVSDSKGIVQTSTLETPSFYFDKEGMYTITLNLVSSACKYNKTIKTIVKITPDKGKDAAPAPNMYSANIFGTMISAYTMDENGKITSGPYDHFDPFPTANAITAALAMDDKGNYFYLPTYLTGSNPLTSSYKDVNGVVEVWAVDKNASNTPVKVATFDLNGSSTSELGLFRLGLDDKGNAWILAGDGTNLYIASFKTNGTKVIKNADITYRPISIENGSAADFESGDLAFDNKGNMYVLAGSSTGTHIYTMSSNASASDAKLSKKWTVKNPSGTKFSLPVTGTVFDSKGSMYFSAIDGIYRIDYSKVSAITATAIVEPVSKGFGLMDMATSQFPAAWAPPAEMVVLPLQLLQFTGSRQGEKIKLDWQVAQNETGSHFELEKSTDGNNFKTLTLLFTSEKTGEETYNFGDAATASNKVFYRLKMVNKDQTISYSNILHFGNQQTASLQLSMLQNPVSNNINFTYNTPVAHEAQTSVYNISGTRILNTKQSMQQGLNSFSLPADQLAPGMYILEVMNNGTRQTAKFYKH